MDVIVHKAEGQDCSIVHEGIDGYAVHPEYEIVFVFENDFFRQPLSTYMPESFHMANVRN